MVKYSYAHLLPAFLVLGRFVLIGKPHWSLRDVQITFLWVWSVLDEVDTRVNSICPSSNWLYNVHSLCTSEQHTTFESFYLFTVLSLVCLHPFPSFAGCLVRSPTLRNLQMLLVVSVEVIWTRIPSAGVVIKGYYYYYYYVYFCLLYVLYLVQFHWPAFVFTVVNLNQIPSEANAKSHQAQMTLFSVKSEQNDTKMVTVKNSESPTRIESDISRIPPLSYENTLLLQLTHLGYFQL